MSNKINEAELDYRVKYKINKYNVKLIKYKNNQGRQISHVKEFQIIYVSKSNSTEENQKVKKVARAVPNST